MRGRFFGPRVWLPALLLAFALPLPCVAQVFEVASVRPSKADAAQHTNVPLDAGDVYGEIGADDTRSAAGGYLVATHQALWRYISFAYKLTGTQELGLRFNMFAGVPKSGAPFWVTGSFNAAPEYFDISAQAGAHASIEELRVMMRALLAERFHLVVHTVTADAPVFGLVQVKAGTLGPALKVHAPGDGCVGALPEGTLPPVCGVIAHVPSTAVGLHYGGRGVPLSLLATSVPTMTGLAAMPRPVVDQTGLAGLYDFTLSWEHDGAGGDAVVGDNAANFRDALKRQLGLALKNTHAPIEFLVVDRVERPSAN